MSVILDQNNDNEEVVNWDIVTFAIQFKPSGSFPTDCGFDWIDIDRNGKVSSHRKHPKNSCTHVINEDMTDLFDARTDDNYQKQLTKVFPIVNSQMSNKLHVSESWMSVMLTETDAAPATREVVVEMNIKADRVNRNNPANLYFIIPNGIEMTIGANTYSAATYSDVCTLTNNKVEVTLQLPKTGGADRKEDIRVFFDAKHSIEVGRLSIDFFAKRVIPVVIWPLVDIPSTLSDAEKVAKVNAMILSESERNDLQTRLNTLYAPAGVQFDVEYATYAPAKTEMGSVDAQDNAGGSPPAESKTQPTPNSGYVSFDFSSKEFDDFRRVGGQLKNAGVFFWEIDNAIDPKSGPQAKLKGHLTVCGDFVYTNNYVNLFVCNLTDNETSTTTTSLGAAGDRISTTTEIVQGFGAIGGGGTVVIFNYAFKKWGVYAHEIGHFCGLSHSFEDANEIEELENIIERTEQNIVQAKSTVVSDWDSAYFEKYLADNETEKELFNKAEISERQEIRARYYDSLSEPYPSLYAKKVEEHKVKLNNCYKRRNVVLYTQKSTENIMDYHENHEFFTKWQCMAIRLK